MPLSGKIPQSRLLEFTLMGYAVRDGSKYWGYYRSMRESWNLFDKDGGRAQLLVNYRHKGDYYRTLWGFECLTGECLPGNSESHITKCGLEQVLLTVDHSGLGQITTIDEDAPRWRKKYMWDFLSQVAEIIVQNQSNIISYPPVNVKRGIKDFPFGGFPEEFKDAFKLAIPHQHAYSLPRIKIRMEVEKLGLRTKPGNSLWGILPETATGGYRRQPHRNSG